MQVLAQGDVTVYERAGQYQLNVIQLQLAGQGELALAFERLKRKLADEGLFDQEHKKEIPRFPKTIGIVTSPTGAAIRDIVKVARRRWPGIELILNPVPVQGQGAAEKIAQAIREFNEYALADLLIVGRGGGSLEDLWAFNEESVARAIYESRIPVISAVGHEIDFTIADLVADLRAPTPSAAAELAVPEQREVLGSLRDMGNRLDSAMLAMVESRQERLRALRGSYGMNRLHDIVRQRWQQMDMVRGRLQQGLSRTADRAAAGVGRLDLALRALNPELVMARGYSICLGPGEKVVRRASSLSIGDRVRTRFAVGSSRMKVEGIEIEKK